MQIITENLSYTYSKSSKSLAVRAIDNVSLSINEGDFFGIIGHTGSGKSTFIQHLNGLIRVEKDCGKIKIGEFDLTDKKCDFKSLRAKVGMVFQYPEYQLFAETIREDIAFGIKNFYPEKSESETEELVKEAMELVGLDYEKQKDKSPFEVSGGQKRRIAIAGVIVSKPEVLVLDEPVAGLDPKGKEDFLNLLKTLHKTTVKTIVIVSHDMNLVAENCNKIAVFSGGRVIKVGIPKEVFMDGKELESVGLSLPLTGKLCEKLNEKGIKIDTDFTVKDFIDKTVKAFKGGSV